MKLIKNKSGQSLVELIFAVGVVAVVITGVMILMVNTISSKNKGFDRSKATELADVVMEGLVNQKINDPVNFWNLENKIGQTDPNFSGFKYSVGFSGWDCLWTGRNDCANATVNVGWGDSQAAVLQRFFSKKGN